MAASGHGRAPLRAGPFPRKRPSISTRTSARHAALFAARRREPPSERSKRQAAGTAKYKRGWLQRSREIDRSDDHWEERSKPAI